MLENKLVIREFLPDFLAKSRLAGLPDILVPVPTFPVNALIRT